MARATLIFGCMCLVAVLLFAIGGHTTAQLAEQIRLEYAANVDFIGHERALRLLASALDSNTHTGPVAQEKPRSDAVSKVVSRATSGVPPSLATNEYLRALDALLRLVMFRAGCVMAVVPGLTVFLFAAVVDGAVRRTVKAHEFSAHDPEVVALSMICILVLMFAMVALLMWPEALPPTLIPSLLFPIAFALNRAVSNYRH